eukprot:scpid70162/ scgid29001/ 
MEGCFSHTAVSPPRISKRRIQVCRWLGFGACIPAMIVAGSVYAFNAYSDGLKTQLSLTQSQEEDLLSIGVVATCIGFTAGLLIEHFGLQLTATVAAITSFLGYLFMGLTLDGKVTRSYGFLAFSIFLTGQGSIFFYMLSLMSTAVNFPLKVRGTMFGFLDAMYGGSATIWSTIYGETFGKSNNAADQNVAGYLYTVGAASAAAGLVCIVAVRHLPFDMDTSPASVPDKGTKQHAGIQQDGYTASSNSSRVPAAATNVEIDDPLIDSGDGDALLLSDSHGNSSTVPDDDDDHAQTQDKSLKQLVCSLDFHLLFWPFIMVSAMTTMFIANVTFYLKAFHLEDEYRRLLTIMIPGLGLVFRIILGFTSDRTIKVIPRSFYISFTMCFLCVGLVLLRVKVGVVWVLMFNAVTMALAAAGVWCLVPTVVTEISGVKSFGRVWGIVMLFSGATSVLYQVVFGRVYDAHVAEKPTPAPGLGIESSEPTPATCYGAQCFSASTDMILASAIVSVCMILSLAVRQWRGMRRVRHHIGD